MFEFKASRYSHSLPDDKKTSVYAFAAEEQSKALLEKIRGEFPFEFKDSDIVFFLEDNRFVQGRIEKRHLDLSTDFSLLGFRLTYDISDGALVYRKVCQSRLAYSLEDLYIRQVKNAKEQSEQIMTSLLSRF